MKRFRDMRISIRFVTVFSTQFVWITARSVPRAGNEVVTAALAAEIARKDARIPAPKMVNPFISRQWKSTHSAKKRDSVSETSNSKLQAERGPLVRSNLRRRHSYRFIVIARNSGVAADFQSDWSPRSVHWPQAALFSGFDSVGSMRRSNVSRWAQVGSGFG